MARVGTIPFTPPAIDPTVASPIYRQLYDGLREAILAGRLAPGAQLPSTRSLAATLGVARMTVIGAFEMLASEGYVESIHGGGTYVARTLPDELLRARRVPARPPERVAAHRGLSRRGAALARLSAVTVPDHGAPRAFRPCVPDLEAFPWPIWGRLAAKRRRRAPHELLNYGSPLGYRPLREAIAAHLGAARAVRCEPDQVLILAGAQQGLDLAARLLLDPGDAAWVEEPGYMGARGALRAAGAELVPLPCDAEGLAVGAGVAAAPGARLAYVTPSHQFPLGMTMSLPRRLALLDWAARSGAWIVEDDYDSEFRYSGPPLAALQGLDTAGRVIYMGTFSKVLFPSLRLGYLVLPHDLVEPFAAARALVDRHPPLPEQATLADFVAEGHFLRHLRRMRALYAERQAALIDALRVRLGGLIGVDAQSAGMQLVGWLPEGTSDRALSRLAQAAGIEAPPLSAYALAAAQRPGLLLGFAAFPVAEIADGVGRLAAALDARPTGDWTV